MSVSVPESVPVHWNPMVGATLQGSNSWIAGSQDCSMSNILDISKKGGRVYGIPALAAVIIERGVRLTFEYRAVWHSADNKTLQTDKRRKDMEILGTLEVQL